MSDQPGEMPKIAPQSDATANDAPLQVEGEKFDAARAMALIEKLRNEVKDLKPKAKQAEELTAAMKAREEAEMTALQKSEKRAAELEATLKATQRTAIASNIAARLGLPQALADRLKGETPEEMEADAKALLETLPKSPKQSPGPIPNPGTNGQQQMDPAAKAEADYRRRMYGEPGGAFDIAALRAQGGGVYMPDQPKE